jgi:hypothetical protein
MRGRRVWGRYSRPPAFDLILSASSGRPLRSRRSKAFEVMWGGTLAPPGLTLLVI